MFHGFEIQVADPKEKSLGIPILRYENRQPVLYDEDKMPWWKVELQRKLVGAQSKYPMEHPVLGTLETEEEHGEQLGWKKHPELGWVQ